MTAPSASAALSPRDYLLLIVLCAALYVPADFSGRPVSVHEARLPELAREMVQGRSEWILPQSGGRPWLERPPLPHWFTAASMIVFRRTDALWVARIPPALAGAGVVLCAAWIAARWFGREVGLLAGVVAASSYELYQYATLAEDDIYLAALVVPCMALFVASQWRPGAENLRDAARSNPVNGRPWTIVGFFILLGLTNLAKGPLVGAVPIIATVGVYLLASRDRRALRQYAWLWGWLIFLGLTAAWPWYAQRRYPDVWENWRFDYLGRSAAGGNEQAAHQWDQPPWYYLMMLPLALAPWTWATLVGLLTTARRAWHARSSPERFLWCWAWVGLLVLSLPARKHHHYLVPLIAPWAILSTLGLYAVVRSWSRRNAQRLVGAVVGGFIVCAAYVQLRIAGRDDATLAEMAFLRTVERSVPAGQTVLVNSDTASLRFFRLQFGLRSPSRVLHNLTYLRDREIRSPVVYLLTRGKDQPLLERLGDVRVVAQTAVSRRERSAGDRFTLFEISLSPDLPRYPLPPYIGVMQAMGRKPGPWCGSPLEADAQRGPADLESHDPP